MRVQISVIIPVYNTEKYLPKALDSVLAQSFTDFEIICVDDGSKDTSLSILEQYAAKDKRVHVIAQENQGVSVARNVAVEKAKGKYIFFFDSDDILKDFALKEMFELAETNQAEIICTDYEKFNESGIRPYTVTPGFSKVKINKDVFNWKDVPDALIETDALLGPVWGRLILRAFYLEHQFTFPKGVRYAEDCVVCLPMMLKAERISVLPKVIIEYRLLKKPVKGKEIFFDFFDAYSLMDKAIEGENSEKLNGMLSRRKVDIFRRSIKEALTPQSKQEFKEKLKSYLSADEYAKVLEIETLRYKTKKALIRILCAVTPSKQARRKLRRKYL